MSNVKIYSILRDPLRGDQTAPFAGAIHALRKPEAIRIDMSLASIPGASDSLVDLLARELRELNTQNQGQLTGDPYCVKLFQSTDFNLENTNTVSLFLYRVDVDEARRNVEMPSPSLGRSGSRWLGLELSYLLTVWGQKSASGEQNVLQNCMEILHEFAILQGSNLSSKHRWEPEDAMRISLAPMNHEDLMRLWDGFDVPYQLSVPYLVRTVRLAPRELVESLVTSRGLAFGSRLSP